MAAALRSFLPFSRARKYCVTSVSHELKGAGGDEEQHGAYEISIVGVPRSYRDRKELALQGAQFLKARNPNSVVKLKDLQTGEEIVVAFKGGSE